jgi:hypothetical protein
LDPENVKLIAKDIVKVEYKEKFSYKVDFKKADESKNKLDLLLFSKKNGEVESSSTSSGGEERMEAMLPGIETRNQYVDKLRQSTE